MKIFGLVSIIISLDIQIMPLLKVIKGKSVSLTSSKNLPTP
jgi:hypothetical protein